MPRFQRACHGLDATDRLGADLAAVLRAGDVVRLDGEMGAGKTTLVRAIASHLGVHPDGVSSPTFVIMNVYDAGKGRPAVAHLDCSRLGSGDDLDAVGFDRVIDGSSIVLLEWGGRVADALPTDTARVSIEPIGEHARLFTIETPDSWAERAGMPGLEMPPDTTCPVTGRQVRGDAPTWPFADERARLADLHGWMTGGYTISRPIEERDLEEGT